MPVLLALVFMLTAACAGYAKDSIALTVDDLTDGPSQSHTVVELVEQEERYPEGYEEDADSINGDDEFPDLTLRNLVAQEVVARAASESLKPAWLQAGASVMAVILIGFTLLYTKRAAEYAGDAVEEAKRATAAARDAVEVNREIGIKQTRAYLSIDKVDIFMKDHDGVGYGVHPVFEIAINNSGNSPAIGVMVNIRTAYIHDKSDVDIRGNTGFFPREYSGGWGHNVKSGGMFHQRIGNLPSFLNEEDRRAFVNAQLHIVSSIKTQFEDVFGNIIEEEFHCMAYFASAELGRKVSAVKSPLSVDEYSRMAEIGRQSSSIVDPGGDDAQQ